MSITYQTNYGIAGRSATILAGFCCSGCFNPVVASVTVSSQKAGYIAPIGGAKKHLQRENQTEEECGRMRDAVLSYLADPVNAVFPADVEGLETNITIRGFASKCPVCGNTEPWQDKARRAEMEIADQIRIFNTLKEAYAWAQNVLRQQKTEADTMWKSPAQIEQGRIRRRQLETYIEELEARKDSGPEKQRVTACRERERELQIQLDSMISIGKKRNELKERIDESKAETRAAEEAYQTLLNQVNIYISRAKKECAELTRTENRLPDRAILCESKDRMALRFASEKELSEDACRSLLPIPGIVRYRVSEYEEDKQGGLHRLTEELNNYLRQTGRLQENEA